MENKFIAQADKGTYNIWKYIGGIFIVLLGCFLFSLPYNLVIAAKINNGQADASKIEDINYLYTLMDSNLSLLYMMLPFLGGIIFLFFVVKKLHKQSWTSLTTSREKIDYKRVFFSFFLWAGMILLLFLVDYMSNSKEIIWNFKTESFIGLFVIAIILIPVQTSFEEYIFRGYLMQGLGISSQTKWLPLLVTSTVFGLLHYANPEVKELGNGIMFFYIGTGLFLGAITLIDEGIELSLGFHAANNLISALLITTDWTAFQTNALFKDVSAPSLITELLSMIILYPVLFYIFLKKYKWKSFKQKLI